MFGNVGSRLGHGLLSTCRAQRFPARQLASVDPNVLDDYEEGFWLPSMKISGVNTGITYGAQTLGRYTKVGRLVSASGILTLTSKGSATGHPTIEDLPFVAVNDTVYEAVVFSFQANLSSIVGSVIGLVQPSNARIVLYHSNNGAAAALTNANLTNTTTLYFSVTYDAR